ncbi:MAG: hypothetical protein PHO64_15060 [Thiomonas sp.]|nr:hypothetical protein [Thiomonas sp.]
MRRIWPSTGATIDEQQAFVLQLSGAASPQSLSEHIHCHIEGLGEQVAVQQISGAQREALLKALRLSQLERPQTCCGRIRPPEGDEKTWGGPAFSHETNQPQQIVTLRCARKLPAGGEVTLVYGAGLPSRRSAESGKSGKEG